MRLRHVAVSAVAALSLISLDLHAFRPMKPYKATFSASVTAGEPVVASRRMACGYLDYRHFYDGRYPSVEHRYADYMDCKRCGSDALFTFRGEVVINDYLLVGGEVSYQHVWAPIYSGFNDKRQEIRHGHFLYLMPEARLCFFRTRLSTLSSAVSAGIGLYDGTRQHVHPEIQLYPISYTIGTTVYGKVELSGGTMFCGISFGAGVRF